MTLLEVRLKKLSDTCPLTGFGVDLEKNMIEEAKKKYPQMDFLG